MHTRTHSLLFSIVAVGDLVAYGSWRGGAREPEERETQGEPTVGDLPASWTFPSVSHGHPIIISDGRAEGKVTWRVGGSPLWVLSGSPALLLSGFYVLQMKA